MKYGVSWLSKAEGKQSTVVLPTVLFIKTLNRRKKKNGRLFGNGKNKLL